MCIGLSMSFFGGVCDTVPISLAATHPKMLRPSLLSLCAHRPGQKERSLARVQVFRVYQIYAYKTNFRTFFFVLRAAVPLAPHMLSQPTPPRPTLQSSQLLSVFLSHLNPLSFLRLSLRKGRAKQGGTKPGPVCGLPPKGRVAPQYDMQINQSEKKRRRSDARGPPSKNSNPNRTEQSI